MVNYTKMSNRKSVSAPSEDFGEVTVGQDIPNGPARYLLVGTAGTATLMKTDGTTVADVPLQKGYNPLVVRQVVSLGTAADVFYCV